MATVCNYNPITDITTLIRNKGRATTVQAIIEMANYVADAILLLDEKTRQKQECNCEPCTCNDETLAEITDVMEDVDEVLAEITEERVVKAESKPRPKKEKSS